MDMALLGVRTEASNSGYIVKALELLLPVTLKLRRNDRGREVSAEL